VTIVMKLLTQSSKCLKSLRPHSTRFETDHKLTHFGSTYLDGFYMKSTKSTTGRQFSNPASWESVHTCWQYRHVINLEKIDLRVIATGIIDCPKCDWSGPGLQHSRDGFARYKSRLTRQQARLVWPGL